LSEGVHRRTAVGASGHRRHRMGGGGASVPSQGAERRRRSDARRARFHQRGVAEPDVIQIQPSNPIIVKIVEPPGDPTGLAGVLIGSLGLSGFIFLVAIISGVLTAGLLYWIRSRST